MLRHSTSARWKETRTRVHTSQESAQSSVHTDYSELTFAVHSPKNELVHICHRSPTMWFSASLSSGVNPLLTISRNHHSFTDISRYWPNISTWCVDSNLTQTWLTFCFVFSGPAGTFCIKMWDFFQLESTDLFIELDKILISTYYAPFAPFSNCCTVGPHSPSPNRRERTGTEGLFRWLC